MGRLGQGKTPVARSVRPKLSDLMYENKNVPSENLDF
jgi:hypothetical protein